MALTQPGTYVLYGGDGSKQNGWPGITIPDDIAPQDILQDRPCGYMTLLLLFGTTYTFRWATTTQLSPFVPIADDEHANLSDELLEAFQTADFGLDAGLDIDYWRDEVAVHVRNQASTKRPDLNFECNNFGFEGATKRPEFDFKCNDFGFEGATKGPELKFECNDFGCDGEDMDDDIREAMRISLEEFQGKQRSMFPTPSSSPPARESKRRRREVVEISDDDSDADHDSLYSYPSKTLSPTTTSSPIGLGNSVLGRCKTSKSTARTSSARCETIGSSNTAKSFRPLPSGLAGLDRLMRRGQGSAAPTSDNIEEDLTKSKDFVRIAVGPDGKVHTLPKAYVWDRPYFRNPRSGIDRFRFHDEDGVYDVEHPDLAKLDPDDFRFLAEYWEDGDFGLRNPEGPEQTKEAIAQCVAAWEAADKLGVFDLLEHIVEKVQFFEWDNADVLILAVIIYRSPHEPTEAHLTMRKWISSYLAQHFWTYVRDETLGHLFRRKLKSIQELEREVFEKRAVLLASGEDLSDDEGGDDDGL